MANARRRTQRSSRTTARIAARNTASGPMAAALESEVQRAGKILDWQNEMKYINKDLRELLMISSFLFVLLFVVGYFL